MGSWLHTSSYEPNARTSASLEAGIFVAKKIVSKVVGLGVERLLGRDDGDDNSDELHSDDRTERETDQFERLTDAHFHERLVNVENCWRRSFTFTEIREGYAIDRQRRDEERANVTEELLASLKRGDQRVVLGTPGSGKSTICKSVAWRWHDRPDTGSVLYWRTERNRVVSDPESLADQIESERNDDPVLVVAEDATRRGVQPIYEVIHEYAGADDVSFLLDSREQEWRNFGDRLEQTLNIDPTRDHGTEVLGARDSIERYRVPELDEREVSRIVRHFEDVTDRSVRPSSAELFERVRTEAGASPMLLLSYHLLVGSGAGRSGQMLSSPLETHVQEVFDAVQSGSEFSVETTHDVDLLSEVALLINVLNAADIEVRQELIHTLADDEHDHTKIARFRDELEGKLLFDTVRGTRYLSNHELWSMLYFDRHLDEYDEETTKEMFERCINAVLSITETEPLPHRLSRVVRAWTPGVSDGYATVREAIRANVDSDTSYLDEVEADRTMYADELVEKLFDIGQSRPKLAPLFGTTGTSGIELPEACSDLTEANCSLWRFRMYRTYGELRIDELEAYREKAASADLDTRKIDSVRNTKRGMVASQNGDYELARGYHQRSLDISSDIDDRIGEANSLGNLGDIACQTGDYEQAHEYHQRSLDIFRNIDDEIGEANSLGSLGQVAEERGDYERACEYFRQSLAIKRNVGAVQGSLKSTKDLTIACKKADDINAAIEACDTGIDIVSDAEISGLDDWREWFENTRSELEETAEADR